MVGQWNTDRPSGGCSYRPAPDYRSAVMRAGPWTVEVVQLRGRDWFPVKLHGYLHGGGPGWQRGLYATVEQVQEQLAEEFAHLRSE